MGSDVYPLNLSAVIHSRNMLFTKLVYLCSKPLFFRLFTSLDGSTFGKVPSISRKSTDVTFPALHAALILWVSRCIASVIVHLRCPLKWLAGSSWCFSEA